MTDTQNINITGITSPALDQHVRDRLHHALNQHEGKIASLGVNLRDINGPRGGDDKQLRIIVGLRVGPNVIIEETGEDAYAIISVAADRVKQTVGRQLAKARTR